MTIDEFIEASKDKSATEEEIRAFEKRIEQREKVFEDESRRLAADNEFMARSYNL